MGNLTNSEDLDIMPAMWHFIRVCIEILQQMVGKFDAGLQ